MVDHALAAHFGRVRGQHGDDQALAQQFANLLGTDPLGLQSRHRFRKGRAAILGMRLPVLGKVGQQRKQHEATDKGNGIVKIQRLEPGVDLAADAAVAINARRADIFGLPEQLFTAIGANDIAQHPAKKADIRILLDGLGCRSVHDPDDCERLAPGSSDIAMQRWPLCVRLARKVAQLDDCAGLRFDILAHRLLIGGCQTDDAFVRSFVSLCCNQPINFG